MNVTLSEIELMQIREHFANLDSSQEVHIKILLVGNGGVGKRCLHERLIWGVYAPEYDPTLEQVDDMLLEVDNRKVTLSWYNWTLHKRHETPERFEEYCKMANTYMETCDACILCYSGIARETFESLSWLHALWQRSHGGIQTHKQLVLAGLKEDCSEEWTVSEDEARAFARKINAPFTRMSSLTGKGVTEADIADIVRMVIIKKLSNEILQERKPALVQARLSNSKIKSELTVAVLGAHGTGEARLAERIVSGTLDKGLDSEPADGWRTQVSVGESKISAIFEKQTIQEPEHPRTMEAVLKLVRKAQTVLFLYDASKPDTLEQIKTISAAAFQDQSCVIKRKSLFLVDSCSDKWGNWETSRDAGEELAKDIGAELLLVSAFNEDKLSKSTLEYILVQSLLKPIDGDDMSGEECGNNDTHTPRSKSILKRLFRRIESRR